MKTVCDLFNFPAIADFHGYRIETFDPLPYFPRGSHWTLSDFILWGHLGFDHRRAIATSAAGVDRLYRERDRNYMRMVGDFIDRFRDFDLIVMSNNFIHPELLVHELKRPIKVLGFFDDPIQRGANALAFFTVQANIIVAATQAGWLCGSTKPSPAVQDGGHEPVMNCAGT